MKEDFRKFGNVREKYNGIGKVTVENIDEIENDEVDVLFSFIQRINGELAFYGELKNFNDVVVNFPGRRANKFECKVEDGTNIKLLGNLLFTGSNVNMNEEEIIASVYGIPSQWEIGEIKLEKPMRIIFEITNLSLNFGIITNINGKEVIVNTVSNYKEIIERLKVSKGIEVTATITVEISRVEKLEEIIAMVEKICLILSVAKSTQIDWISFHIVDREDNRVYSRYRNSITKPFVSQALIYSPDSKELLNFINGAYQQFQKRDDIFLFQKLVRSYIETKSGYIEVRGLVMSVIIEFIASRLAQSEGRTTFMEKNEFEEKIEPLQNSMILVLKEIFPKLKINFIHGMASKATGLNYRSLSGKVKKLNRYLGTGFSRNEISEFVQIRNSLAHSAAYPEDTDPKESFRKITSMLDRIMLRLFGFEGHYYDIYKNSIELIEVD